MWEGASERELEALADYSRFEYGTKLQIFVRPITSSVFLQQMLDFNGLLLKDKARLVVYGFRQLPGYDYHES